MATKASGKGLRITLIILAAFIVLFSIVSMIIVKKVYDGRFGRAETPEFSGYLRYEDIEGYDRSVVKFMSGENELTGYIYGEDNSKGLVVIAHGLGGGAEDYLPETLYFVDHGWRVLAYDCTGSYESQGDGTLGLPQSVIDLRAALDYINADSTLSSLPVMLYGHSWGGFAVTAVLNDDYQISAVASISGYNTPMGLLYEQAKGMMGFFATIEYPYLWAYQRMLFGRDAGLSAVDGINKSGIPVMIIHGTGDNTILYDGAGIIAQRDHITNANAVFKPCSQEGRDDHNHLFRSQDAMEYIDTVNKAFKTIYDSYNGDIPHDVKAEFYQNIDKFKTSELDADFMDSINRMFEDSLQK